MICKKCGRNIPDQAVLCGYCGALVSQSNEEEQPSQQPNQQPYRSVPPVYQSASYQSTSPYHTIPNYNPNADEGSYGMAVASLVLGILALLFSCCIPGISLILLMIGVILGIVSLIQKKGGAGMAIAGLLCCGIALILSLLVLLCSFAIIGGFNYF